MAIVRWEPAGELASMEIDRLNRMFSDFYGEAFPRAWVPPVDIYETDAHEVVLKAELPGLKRDDIDLTVENNTLTIRGERRKDETVPEDRYHRIERIVGPFLRSFTLPATVDASRVRAEYRDGVLTVTLPTRAEARPRQIEVNVSE